MTVPRFFFDRCCSVKLARLAAVFEDAHEVRHYSDDVRFTPTTDDVDWIGELGRDRLGWVIVSEDIHILRRPHERQALIESGLAYFLFGSAWNQMQLHEKCWKFLKVWPDLVRTAREQRHRLFEVKAGGNLKIEPR